MPVTGSAKATPKTAPKDIVTQTILTICNERPCTLEELAHLLQRSTSVILKDYVQPMLKISCYPINTQPNPNIQNRPIALIMKKQKND